MPSATPAMVTAPPVEDTSKLVKSIAAVVPMILLSAIERELV